jgi:hypothetical protein
MTSHEKLLARTKSMTKDRQYSTSRKMAIAVHDIVKAPYSPISRCEVAEFFTSFEAT